ncbi:hypothetical protein E2320_002692, partial [Naja naja]
IFSDSCQPSESTSEFLHIQPQLNLICLTGLTGYCCWFRKRCGCQMKAAMLTATPISITIFRTKIRGFKRYEVYCIAIGDDFTQLLKLRHYWAI